MEAGEWDERDSAAKRSGERARFAAQDFARTLWHELTHELEDENGDSSDPRIAQFKSAGQPIERFNERNAWYMEEAYGVLTVQVSLFEQNLANGDPPAKLQAQWANVRKAFQDLAQPSDR